MREAGPDYPGIWTTEGKLHGLGNTKKLSLNDEVKFLKAKMLPLTM
jgi:hypothetical protein